ncbi:MAG: dTDP-4-dehydrorhamnose 3,5-epimerase [Alphaproteobacteria bacterium]|nr:MAG: dTDP-4-dehydrorhamnose 3,5-epimerase [Alphaproteobacteria bacterium]PZO40279.1 MAG: dTDP-4-dehydrorhamnose 3,5-epimerase [Alphaproteobacteria bacterium]
MRFERTLFNGLLVVHPERMKDERGHFARTFCEEAFGREGLESRFPQASISFNATAGTVRGMHYQHPPHAETKLVRCTRGAVSDIVVDLRPGEPTYGQWQAFDLSAANGLALYIPAGFAHGFQTLQGETELIYLITPSFKPGMGAGLCWDDPAFGIHWPLPVSAISTQDRDWPRFEALNA